MPLGTCYVCTMKISKVVGGGPGQIPLRALSPRSGFRPFPTKTDDVAPPVWRGILALKHLKASATLCRNCEIHSIPDATLTDLHGHGRRLFSGLRNGAYVHSNTRLLFVSTPRAPIDPAKFPPPPPTVHGTCPASARELVPDGRSRSPSVSKPDELRVRRHA